jgi:Flp pilus assembly protein TadD
VNPLRWLPPVFLVAIFVLPVPVFAQKGMPHPFFNAQINVQVRDVDGMPGPQGAQVILQLEDGSEIDQAQIDSAGKCRFIPPLPAVYVVRVRDPGYLEYTARVDLTTSQTGSVYATLRPIPGRAAPTGITLPGGAGAAVSAADLGVPDDSRKEFEKGQQSLQANNVDDGISHLQKAIQLHDAFPQAYTMLGTAYNQQKKWKEAETALEKAVQLDPKSAEAYIQLGAALNQTNDYAGAEKALTKGLELSPDSPDAPEAHYELARTYWAQRQWQNAEPHLTKALAARPNLAPAHVLMGNVLLRKGDGPGAINEYQEYLKLEPKGSMAGPVQDMISKIEAALKKK